MEIKWEIDLQPFLVPNFVLVKEKPKKRQDGFQNPKSIHLSELGPNTLHQLCENFRAEVFKKAGKKPPPCG